VSNIYAWSGNGSQETIWDWLEELNNEQGGQGYAGHTDWRIPNLRELQSMVDYGHLGLPPVFGPVDLSAYWTSTTTPGVPALALYVFFGHGLVWEMDKTNLARVPSEVVQSSQRIPIGRHAAATKGVFPSPFFKKTNAA
jgi:hypothetical protein